MLSLHPPASAGFMVKASASMLPEPSKLRSAEESLVVEALLCTCLQPKLCASHLHLTALQMPANAASHTQLHRVLTPECFSPAKDIPSL